MRHSDYKSSKAAEPIDALMLRARRQRLYLQIFPLISFEVTYKGDRNLCDPLICPDKHDCVHKNVLNSLGGTSICKKEY